MTRDVLAVVQAGGSGGRMDVLTGERAKPAVPYAASNRLVDFALVGVPGPLARRCGWSPAPRSETVEMSPHRRCCRVRA